MAFRYAVNEAVGRIDGAAESVPVAIPHLHCAPVIIRRGVGQRHILFGVAAFAVLARPIGVGDHDDAMVDDSADHRDMAERESRAARENDDRAGARRIAAPIAPGGLTPPCPGVAINLDAGSGTRKGNALAYIIEQGWRGSGHRRWGEYQRKRNNDATHTCTQYWLHPRKNVSLQALCRVYHVEIGLFWRKRGARAIPYSAAAWP